MKRLVAVSFVVAALMFAAFPRRPRARCLRRAWNCARHLPRRPGEPWRHAGVVAVVVTRQGTLYSGAFGKQDAGKNVPLAADSLFRIASMTKAVTSVAAMMMIEQGKMKLDDDVSKYLPAFKSMSVLTTYDEKADTYDAAEHPADHDASAAHAYLRHRLQLVRPRPRPRAAEDQPRRRNRAAARPRAGREVWTYGASTKVLGDLVEKLSGERIDVFTDRHIAKPLGMVDTSFEVARANYPRVVTTNQKDAAGKITETQNPETLPVQLRADGGLFSTAPDYGRFLQMLLNGGQLGNARILKAGTVSDMLKPHTGGVRVRPQPSANPGLSKPYPLGAGEDIWGLGFQLADPKKADPGMRRPGSGNWAGIFNTFFWMTRKKSSA